MMHRNLDRRVEALVRLPGEPQVARIRALMDLAFAEETSAWELTGEGIWKHNGGTVDLQAELIAAHRRKR
jgi:polyphosphate kinase